MKIYIKDKKSNFVKWLLKDVLLSERIEYGTSVHRGYYTFWAGFALGMIPFQILLGFVALSLFAPIAALVELYKIGSIKAKNHLKVMVGLFELEDRR